MKMKKILCSILSASLLAASWVFPALADEELELMAVADEWSAFTPGTNDVDNIVNLTFDDGTETNDLDGSKAKKNGSAPTVTENSKLEEYAPFEIFDLTGKGNMTKDFFLTMDVRFDTVNSSVPGHIIFKNESTSIKQNSSGNWYEAYDLGPDLYFDKGALKNTKASDIVGANGLSADTWYRLEFEGTTKGRTPCVSAKVYGMKDGKLQCIAQSDSIGLRNFGENSTKKDLVIVRGTDVSVDNVKFVQEYPEEIRPTATLDSIKAGVDRTTLTSVFYRKNTAMTTTYPTTYEVYRGANKIEDGTVTIKDGILETTEDAVPGTITVKATATVRDGVTVTGEKEITIEGVDISGETFHEIELDGEAKVKAGGDMAAYTFTAKKNNAAANITSDDIDWRIYDASGKYRIQSEKISITGGVLQVADDVIAQTINVAAFSKPNGYRNGMLPVEIEFSDNQTEKVLASNAFETPIDESTEIVGSIDGSGAYKMANGKTLAEFEQTGSYVYTEFDANFAGVTNNGDVLSFQGKNTPFTLRKNGGKLATFDGKNYGGTMTVADDKWYHVGILFSGDLHEASMVMAEYDDEGNLGTPERYQKVATRNSNKEQKYGQLDLGGGVIIDNLKIVTPEPDTLTLTPQYTSMFPTESNQITAELTKNGLPMQASRITWTIFDSSNQPIVDNSITIDASGLMKATAMAPEGVVTVQAKTATATATVPIEIKSSEIFKMQNIGVNEDGDKVVKLYVKKLLAYDDDVVFVMAFYDENHILKEIRTLKGYGSNYTNIGEDTMNEVTVDWAIPSGFDKTTGEAKVFIWTAF